MLCYQPSLICKNQQCRSQIRLPYSTPDFATLNWPLLIV
jgi:hypothetical protein